MVPSVLHCCLVPPFVYRLPIPAITPSDRYSWQGNLDSWKGNFDIKNRLHNIRLLIGADLSYDELAGPESEEIIEGIINRSHSLESYLFFHARNANAYHSEVAEFVGAYWEDNSRNLQERVPSLTELSFRAVWREMAWKEQEEFALHFNSTDAVHDLRRFISQKATSSGRFIEKRISQKEIPE